MITSILQQIESMVRKPENKIFDPENYASYIGTISYSRKSFVFETDSVLRLSPSQWDDFNELEHMLKINPLGKKGMVPSWEDNKRFLERELAVWTCKEELNLNNAPWMEYIQMWDNIPNVSDCAYGKLMSSKFAELRTKLEILADSSRPAVERTAINRSLVVNFPNSGFCPIGMSFCFYYDQEHETESIHLMLNFRSLEVSRNIKNDMYLFLGYLKALLSEVSPTQEFDISRFVLTVQDAHIIELA